MSEIQSRAKATIARRTIQQINPVQFKWHSGPINTGFTAQTVSSVLGAGPGPTKSTITFNSENKPVLVITGDGEVIWNGKPSQAADVLVQSFQFKVEQTKGFKKAARKRYYSMALNNIAKKADTMSAAEFVDFVKKQAYNRDSKVLIDILKGELDD